MTLETKYMTQNANYLCKRTTEVKGIMLHSVGCPQPSPDVFAKNWNKSSTQVGVHGFIGSDKVIITLPCLESTSTSKPGYVHRAWHCGTGKRGSFNNGYIAFECCEPATIKYTKGSTFTCSNPTAAATFMKKVFKNAVEIFAKCCIYHNLDPSGKNVIICHSEAYELGYASNHGDVEHLLKQLPLNYTMDQFREDVIAKVNELKGVSNTSTIRKVASINNTSTTKTTGNISLNTASVYSKEARDWAISNGIITGNGTLSNGEPNYMWQNNMTREQFITVLHRFGKKTGLIK